MAKNDNLLGCEQIEIGAPGDGVMGSTLTSFTAVELSSLSLSGAEANEETIASEQEDSYLTIANAASPTTAQFRLLEVFGDDAVLIMGGSFSGSTWNAPEAVPDLYLSVRITTKPINGFKFQVELPYARISARHEGTVSRNSLLAVQVTATANTPVAADDSRGAPYSLIKTAA